MALPFYFHLDQCVLYRSHIVFQYFLKGNEFQFVPWSLLFPDAFGSYAPIILYHYIPKIYRVLRQGPPSIYVTRKDFEIFKCKTSECNYSYEVMLEVRRRAALSK